MKGTALQRRLAASREVRVLHDRMDYRAQAAITVDNGSEFVSRAMDAWA